MSEKNLLNETPKVIENAHSLEQELEKLNNDFNEQLHKNKKYKWYSPRIGNLVIPQVYDDSLSYYEAINKLQLLLHCEIDRAMSAENLLGVNLDSEIQRAKQAEENLQKALNAEINRAQAAEDALNTKIDKETERAKAAEQVLTNNLNSEIARAKQAEADLNNALNTEIDRAKAAEQANTNLINAETTRAKAEEQKAVTNVSLESNGSTHVIKQTINDKTTEVGEIDTAENNCVVEVKDSIVTNDTGGFDFHTLSETTEDGTSNNIGQAYLAQKQITSIDLTDSNLNVKTVDQSGKEETATHEVVTPAGLQEVEEELRNENSRYFISASKQFDEPLENNAIYTGTCQFLLKEQPEGTPKPNKLFINTQPHVIRKIAEAENTIDPLFSLDTDFSPFDHSVTITFTLQTLENSNVSGIDFWLYFLNRYEYEIDGEIILNIEKKISPFVPKVPAVSKMRFYILFGDVIPKDVGPDETITIKKNECGSLNLWYDDEAGEADNFVSLTMSGYMEIYYNDEQSNKITLNVTPVYFQPYVNGMYIYFRANEDLTLTANTIHLSNYNLYPHILYITNTSDEPKQPKTLKGNIVKGNPPVDYPKVE